MIGYIFLIDWMKLNQLFFSTYLVQQVAYGLEALQTLLLSNGEDENQPDRLETEASSSSENEDPERDTSSETKEENDNSPPRKWSGLWDLVLCPMTLPDMKYVIPMIKEKTIIVN